jgi:hypothetical protein
LRRPKLKQAAIAAADRFELTLEALLESQQRIAAGLGGGGVCAARGIRITRIRHLPAQQIVGQSRHQRARQDVGGDQRKHDCFCQRAEEIARHTAEAEHWYESEADAHQRYGSRDNDLLRAVQNCSPDLLAVFKVPVDVLDCHRSVVDQDADCERQPPECHDVDDFTEHREHCQRGQDGERNRDGMIRVERQLPRNSRIINPVSAAAMTPSRTTLETALVTNTD